jgi:hypothetical protein
MGFMVEEVEQAAAGIPVIGIPFGVGVFKGSLQVLVCNFRGKGKQFIVQFRPFGKVFGFTRRGTVASTSLWLGGGFREKDLMKGIGFIKKRG